MARADETRVSVRMSWPEREAIQRAARVAGISDGALLRECGLRWGPVLAAAISTGDERVAMPRRRRNREAP